MPAIRYYTVVQVREVRVAANTPAQAVQVADQAFNGVEVAPDLSVRLLNKVKATHIAARED